MEGWKYIAVKTQNSNVLEEWINSLPQKGQAKVDTLLRRLRITRNWKRPQTGSLTGYDKIIEIIIEFNNVQYRPLGCYGPGRGVFTFLFIATEKGDKFVPKDAPKIAEKMCKQVHNGEIEIEDYE
jgi:hypothetical protein